MMRLLRAIIGAALVLAAVAYECLDQQLWANSLIANCPNHAGIKHVPTPWEAEQGRLPRVEMYDVCTPVSGLDRKQVARQIYNTYLKQER